jgi:hypothetical protein
MAVDVLVMPLARYLSGNYVTPAMEQAWREHGSYAFGTPSAIEEIPPGVPLGGLHAAQRAEQFHHVLAEAFQQIPAAKGYPWGERPSGATYFQRLDHDLLLELRWQAAVSLEQRPGWFARLWGKRASTSHLASAAVFLPADFAEPFELSSTADWDDLECGSLPRLIAELQALDPLPTVEESSRTLLAAALVAWEERLPLILDI